MYFNENKENTNIDEEFDKKSSYDYSKFKKPVIILIGIILLLIIILLIISLTKKKTTYFVKLDGSEEMIIYKGSTYNEPGYEGYDSKNRTYNVTVSGDVDTSKVGTYTLTYSLQNASKTRTVKVIEVPENPTIIHLNGNKNMTLRIGEKYEEPGYNAIDYVDGDLTKNVKITGSVNTGKEGIYRLIYSVVNSKGVTTSETRVITVK